MIPALALEGHFLYVHPSILHPLPTNSSSLFTVSLLSIRCHLGCLFPPCEPQADSIVLTVAHAAVSVLNRTDMDIQKAADSQTDLIISKQSH